MTFEKIFKDSNCNCLDKSMQCQEDLVYLRKLRKQKLEEADFLTHWERGKEAEADNCEYICGLRGISIDFLQNDSDDYTNAIVNRYKTTFTINPKKGAHCLKFRFKIGSGNVKHTPFDGAESHHDFYKSDHFQISTHLEALAIIHFN